MKRVMLYFGSFNPPHAGHLAIAEYVVREGISDEVWLVVSPENPLKKRWQLASEDARLAMTKLMVEGRENIKVCDVEFRMERPSYTIDTLNVLVTEYPDTKFSLLIGSDIVPQFEQWKSWQEIAERYDIYVYPRKGYEGVDVKGFHKIDAPIFPISSTMLRHIIERDGTIDGLVAPRVAKYIAEHNLYGETTSEYYLESGKANYAKGEFGAALNDFMRAQELGDNAEAAHFEELVRSILNFRYTDIYNP